MSEKEVFLPQAYKDKRAFNGVFSLTLKSTLHGGTLFPCKLMIQQEYS